MTCERDDPVDQLKWDFLHEEILTMSISAAFMFGRIYGPDVGERDRLTVREGLKAELRDSRSAEYSTAGRPVPAPDQGQHQS